MVVRRGSTGEEVPVRDRAYVGVRATHGDELFSIQAVRLFFMRQGFVRLDHLNGYEPFAGQRFKINRWRLQSNAQLFRWLST